MTNPKQLDFMTQFTENRIRKEIRNICDSYSHPWDILAELCQNSIDAIKRWERHYGKSSKKEHRIEVHIDARDRSIIVFDTGCGFPPDRFLELLAPHGTDKEAEPGSIGEKGVGLTYTIFMADRYEMESVSTQGKVAGYIDNASSWKNIKLPGPPAFIPTDTTKQVFTPQQTFTSVKLRHIEQTNGEEDDLFRQSMPILEYWLRTRTAVGNLGKLFQNLDLPIKMRMSFTDDTGSKFESDESPTYMLPTEFLNKSDIIELGDFTNKAAAMTDEQKSRRFAGKCLYKKSSVNRHGREIRYFAMFVPSRDVWSEISDKANLVRKDTSGKIISRLFESGIFVATRGMPTGIVLEPPSTGEMGYWPNMFILLEDDSITFDLGRKSVPGRTKGTLREISREIFNDFNRYMSIVSTKKPPVTSGTGGTLNQYVKNKEFEELAKLPDLGLDTISYRKHPADQEAAVVALFHELVGAGIIKGYYSLKTGYKMTYDLWARYRIDKNSVPAEYQKYADHKGFVDVPAVLEFKYSGESILDDLENQKKFFTDIDLIVCWDLNEQEFARQSVNVQPLPASEVFFYGSNYLLEWPGTFNLGNASRKPVLALRKFIQDLMAK